ncbi:FtsX-like permease family protein [Arthrobacter sp.]|uniref:FtsX-like permease family protein n=1 Tax=Arthrobacter sp. TaxID=1667 RepID=UPI003A8D6535
MGATSLRKRAASRSRLLALLGVTILALTAILAGALAYSQLASVQALRSTLIPVHAPPLLHRIHTTASGDPAAQQATASSLMQRMGLSGGLDATVSQRSGIYPVRGVADGASVQFTSFDGAPDRLPVREGTFPTEGTPGVAITSTTADAWHLDVGDVLVADGPAGGLRLPVRAIVDPTTTGEALLAPDAPSGSTTAPALAVLPARELTATFPDRQLVWTLTADPGHIGDADLGRLGAGVDALVPAMVQDPHINNSGVVGSGNLAAALRTADQGTQAVGAMLPSALVPLAAVGVVALVQLLRLLAGSRSRETGLLLARGVSGWQLALSNALETGLLALVAAAAGWAAAVATVPALLGWLDGASSAGVPLVPAVLSGTWAVPAVMVLGCLAGAGALGLQAGRAEVLRLDRARRTERPGGRNASALSVIALVFALCVAAFCLWQLRVSGSPLLRMADGTTRVNPPAAWATALLVLSGGGATVLAVALACRALASATRRRPGFLLPSTLTGLARNTLALVLPVFLVTVSLAASVVAMSYGSTFAAATRTSGLLANAAPVRIDVAGSSLLEGPRGLPDPAPYAALPHVSSATLALSLPTRFGQESGSLQALDPGATASALGALPTADAPTLAAALHPTPRAPAVGLPAGTHTATLDLAIGPQPPGGGAATGQDPIDAIAWITGSDGRLVPLESTTTERGHRSGWRQVSLGFDLPEGITSPAIAALDVRLASASPEGTHVELTSLAADGQHLDLPSAAELGLLPNPIEGTAGQVGELRPGEQSPFSPDPTDPSGFTLPATDGQDATVRLVDRPAVPPEPVPALVTETLLDQLGRNVGDVLGIETGGINVQIKIAGTVEVVPGTTDTLAVLVELPALERTELHLPGSIHRPNQLLVDTGDPTAVAAAAAPLLAPGDRLDTAVDETAARFAAPATIVLWLTAFGTFAVAAIALAAHVLALARTRRGEVALLSALGLPAAVQQRARILEMTLLGALATLGGTGVGLAAVALTHASMVRAVVHGVPEALSLPLVVPGVVGLAILVHLGLGAGAGWLSARGSRPPAGNTTGRGDA